MGLTINLVQVKRKQKENGKIPIWIRITENRKSRYKSTGIAVLPKYWNEEDQQISRSHPRSGPLNGFLDQIWHDVWREKLNLRHEGELSLSSLRSKIEDAEYLDLLTYAESYIQQLREEERYWERKHFKVVKGNLENFLNGQSININEIDAEFLESFQKYLLNEAGPNTSNKGNSPNTVRKKLQRLRAMLNRALKNKDLEKDPFRAFEPVEKEKTNTKAKLTLQQIKNIKELNLEEGAKLWHTRNYFLYSFYNAGIRFGDLCTLQWDNIIDGRLIYTMNKTGGQKSIKQNEYMWEILALYEGGKGSSDSYIFPILDKKYSDPMELRKKIGSKNVQVNEDLKKIAEKAGIQANLSFHVSRHSFAHYALEKDMDLYSISKALGHSDLKITEEYLKKFDEEKLDKDMDQLFKDL